MTKKEFDKIKIWKKEKSNGDIRGYAMLFPTAIKFISKPSYHLIESAQLKKSLYVSIESAIIDKDYFIIKDRFCGRVRVHYKYIQYIRIYNYN